MTIDKHEEWETTGFSAEFTASDSEHSTGILRDTHDISFDEPEYIDIGSDEYPSPHDYLIAAVAGCQLSTLKQCLEKSRVERYSIHISANSKKTDVDIETDLPHNPSVLIDSITTSIEVKAPEEDERRVSRCLNLFEQVCPISNSVRLGIELKTSSEFDPD